MRPAELLLAFVAVIIALGLVSALVRYGKFRQRGYRASGYQRDLVLYEELSRDGPRRLVLDGSLLVGGGRVIYIPSEVRWPTVAPSWAAGRREEILSRIVRELPQVELESSPGAGFVEKS